MGSGGGGTAGKVEYPAYMSSALTAMLARQTPSLVDYLDPNNVTSIGGGGIVGDVYHLNTEYSDPPPTVDSAKNPYAGRNTYNPSVDLETNQDRLDDLIDFSDQLDEKKQWPKLFDTANVTGNIDVALAWQKIESLVRGVSLIDTRLDWNTLIPAVDLLTNSGELTWRKLVNNARSTVDADTEFDWSRINSEVVAATKDEVLSDRYISDAVSAHNATMQGPLAEQVAKFSAAMADMGSELSSAFVVGQAILRERHLRNVDQFASDLAFRSHQDRLQYISANVAAMSQLIVSKISYLAQAAEIMSKIFIARYGQVLETEGARFNEINAMIGQVSTLRTFSLNWNLQASSELTRFLFNRGQFKQSLSSLQTDINKIKIISKREQFEQNLEVDVKDRTWNMDLWMHAANVLSSISGASTVGSAGKGNKTASALSGALAGGALAASLGGGAAAAAGAGAAGAASTGAMLGAVGGPVGILAGAAIGGAAAYFMS